MNPALNSHVRQSAKPDSTWLPLMDCAAKEVFQIMLQADLTPTTQEQSEHAGGDTTAMVGLAGSLCGVFSIRCASNTATSLAAKMLGSPDEPGQAEVADAIAEICNMVAGNFKGKISRLADHCMLSVPTVVRGEDYDMVTIADGERVVYVSLMTVRRSGSASSCIREPSRGPRIEFPAKRAALIANARQFLAALAAVFYDLFSIALIKPRLSGT